MSRINKSYRFEEKTVVELDRLSEIWKLNQTKTIEKAIQIAYTNSGNSYTENNVSAVAFEALAKQLSIKDKQIQDLNNRLEETSRALVNAQTLHAVNLKDDLLPEAAEKIPEDEYEKTFFGLYRKKKNTAQW